MPMLDISKVTQTLIKLIKTHVEASPGWDVSLALDVSAEPPDQLNGGNVIGLYMYHLCEDPQYKNLPSPGNDEPPIRYTPMGLNLSYQLTAHSANGILIEQSMMGLAVKALRDYPVIDDNTEINTGTTVEKIMHADLRGNGNRFRIVLQPIPHNEAVSFWTAGSSPLRLAAYYQISVVLLEPEETQRRSGRVLSYNVHAFVSGAPRLNGSKNTLSFSLPDEMALRQVELEPAQVPFVADALIGSDDPKNGDVSFTGAGFGATRTILLLRNSRWDKPYAVDSSWNVTIASDQVKATVQKTLLHEGTPIDILPGMYGASIVAVKRVTTADGNIRDLENSSNVTPFMITPRIDTIDDPDPTDPAAIITVTGWIFHYPGVPPADNELDVQVYLGASRLQLVSTSPPGPKEFHIEDNQTIHLVRPTGLESGHDLPLRIFVNGAESPPNWLRTP